MRINHNISALKINNILSKNNTSLEKSLQRLSSGYRINCAADDAAGLAISEKMKTQIAGLNQASRNASDGISVIQTAEGALIEVEQMLQRMRELAVEAANGSYTDEDRATLQDEVIQLKQEINRISTTTEFNTKTLLDGTVDRRSYSDNNAVKLISLSDSVGVKSYTFEVDKEGSQAVIMTKLRSSSAPDQGKITINNEEVTIEAGDTIDTILTKLTATCDRMGIYVGLTNGVADEAGEGGFAPISSQDALVGTTSLIFVTEDYGSDATLSVSCSNSNLATALGLSGTSISRGTDAAVSIGTESAKGASAVCKGIVADKACGTGSLTYTINNSETGTTETVKFTISAGNVLMEYTDYAGNVISANDAPASNSYADVIASIKTLASRTSGMDALNVSFSESNGYVSLSAVTASSGKDISISVTDDNTGICNNRPATVKGAEYAATAAASEGTMSAIFSTPDGKKCSLEFTINNGEVTMTYIENEATVRTQSSSALPANPTNDDVITAVTQLYSTLSGSLINLTVEPGTTGNCLVFTAADPEFSSVTAYDTSGYLAENTSSDFSVGEAALTYNGGNLQLTIASADGSYTDTVTVTIPAGSTKANIANALNTALATAGSYNGTPYSSIFTLNASGNDFSLESSVSGLSLSISDPSFVLANPSAASNIDTKEDSGTGNIHVAVSNGDTIDFTVTDSLLTMVYTSGGNTLTRTQTLTSDHTNGAVLTAMKELCNAEVPSLTINYDDTDPSAASFSMDSTGTLTVTADNSLNFYNTTISTGAEVTGISAGQSVVTKSGKNAGGFTETTTVSVNGDYITVRDRDGFEMVLQASKGSISKETTVTVLDAGPMTLQIGASEGQTMEIRIPCVDTTTLFIDSADISTQEGAQHAITLFNNAILDVSAIRAKLGAYQNRLDHAINSLDTSAENLTEALSRIADTDMASEMATYTQLQVLVQAATAMLSQANERPQNILNLLQS
jgi:flagellin-like hook-associated protein FlgL